MTVFNSRFYQFGLNHLDVEGYKTALANALALCVSDSERDLLLRQEVIEITRHITDGIRDLIKHDRRIRDLVLNQGAVPLATWAKSLDTLAQHSMPVLRQKIQEMERDLEHGRVEGFPGTMALHQKPTFTAFNWTSGHCQNYMHSTTWISIRLSNSVMI